MTVDEFVNVLAELVLVGALPMMGWRVVRGEIADVPVSLIRFGWDGLEVGDGCVSEGCPITAVAKAMALSPDAPKATEDGLDVEVFADGVWGYARALGLEDDDAVSIQSASDGFESCDLELRGRLVVAVCLGR